MESESEDALKAILRNLEALNDKVDALDNRLNALEQPFADQETAQAVPDFIKSNEAFRDEETISGDSDFLEPAEAETPPPLPAITSTPTTSPSTPSAPPSTVMPPLPLPAAPQSAVNTSQQPPLSRAQRFMESVAEFHPDNVPAEKPKESLEVRIATYWLLRIGLLFLALSCVLLAREYARGPLGKVLSVYGVSVGMIIFGFWKEKKYPTWSRPVLAGGLAFSYFASYAIGFVEPMQLIDSLGLKLAILAANLAPIFGVAHWKKSEIIGGTALILGYLTTGVVGNDTAALCSSLALSIVALVFLWLNGWFVATATACAATYLSHIYVWKAIPEADVRTPMVSFWFHFSFLSLFFLVYAAAGLAGRKAALQGESLTDEDVFTGKSTRMSRADLLAVLAQTNAFAFLGGIILVLKTTQIYWGQAWLFFFPAAIGFALIALMYGGLKVVQTIYLFAAALALSLGIISLASPMWLPVFLTFQGLAMLWGGRGAARDAWRWLSLLVLTYGTTYLLSGGAVDVLDLAAGEPVQFSWWAYAGVCLIMLGYAIRWEKTQRVVSNELGGEWVPYLVSAGAAFTWFSLHKILPMRDAIVLYGSTVPVVTLLSVGFKARGPIMMVTAMAAVSLLDWRSLQSVGAVMDWHVQAIVAIALAGCLAGLYAEKSGVGNPGASRFLWRVTYTWAAIMLGLGIMWSFNDPARYVVIASTFAAGIWIAWIFHSSALGKAAFTLVPFTLGLVQHPDKWDAKIGIPTIALLAVATFPVALPRWRWRTGDTQPDINKAGQAAVLMIAGILFYWTAVSVYSLNAAMALGIWAVFCAVYAAIGRFAVVVWVVLVCGFIAAMHLLWQLGVVPKIGYSRETETMQAVSAGWTLAGVLMFVLAERLISNSDKLAFSGANRKKDWLTPTSQNGVKAALAISSLVLAVMALRLLPEMKLFYFTGAAVAVAFLWIVFGFLFNEPIYRKSGFVLLCIGILKGLIWDVLSLKEVFYRIVSWSILGLLAMAASYLYTRFKGRLDSQ